MVESIVFRSYLHALFLKYLDRISFNQKMSQLSFSFTFSLFIFPKKKNMYIYRHTETPHAPSRMNGKK